jgi:hypothetical protein
VSCQYETTPALSKSPSNRIVPHHDTPVKHRVDATTNSLWPTRVNNKGILPLGILSVVQLVTSNSAPNLLHVAIHNSLIMASSVPERVQVSTCVHIAASIERALAARANAHFLQWQYQSSPTIPIGRIERHYAVFTWWNDKLPGDDRERIW